MTIKLTSNQYKVIRCRVSKGERIQDLAKEYGVSRNSVYSYFRNNPTTWERIKRMFWSKK